MSRVDDEFISLSLSIIGLGLDVKEVVLDVLITDGIQPHTVHGFNMSFYLVALINGVIKFKGIREQDRGIVRRLMNVMQEHYVVSNHFADPFKEEKIAPEGTVLNQIEVRTDSLYEILKKKIDVIEEKNCEKVGTIISHVDFGSQESSVIAVLYDRGLCSFRVDFPYIRKGVYSLTFYEYYYHKYGPGCGSIFSEIINRMSNIQDIRLIGMVSRSAWKAFLWFCTDRHKSTLFSRALYRTGINLETKYDERGEDICNRMIVSKGMGRMVTRLIHPYREFQCFIHASVYCDTCVGAMEGQELESLYPEEATFFSIVGTEFPKMARAFAAETSSNMYRTAVGSIFARVALELIHRNYIRGQMNRNQAYIHQKLMVMSTWWWYHLKNFFHPEYINTFFVVDTDDKMKMSLNTVQFFGDNFFKGDKKKEKIVIYPKERRMIYQHGYNDQYNTHLNGVDWVSGRRNLYHKVHFLRRVSNGQWKRLVESRRIFWYEENFRLTESDVEPEIGGLTRMMYYAHMNDE